jgi:hypothetical protein
MFPPESRAEQSRQMNLTTQAGRFVVTGGLAAIVDFSVYVTLWKVVGLQVDQALPGSPRSWLFTQLPSPCRSESIIFAFGFCTTGSGRYPLHS